MLLTVIILTIKNEYRNAKLIEFISYNNIYFTARKMLRNFNLFVLLSALAEVTSGQSAVRYTLCRDQVVTVIPGSSGIIQYLQEVSSTPINCTLVLRGFRNGSYVSLPGLYQKNPEESCQKLTEISINGLSYCVKETGSNVMEHLMKGELVVQLTSDRNSVDFNFEYYNNG